MAALAWFSDEYRAQFPEKYRNAVANRDKPSTTGSVFHDLADMAFLQSRYMDSTQAFTSSGFVFNPRRMYLNDHNKAVEFYNSGLRPEDFEMLDRHHIEYDKAHVRDILY